MLSLGALDLRSKPPSFLTGWGALFSNGLSGIWLGTKTLQYWTIKPGISAFLKKFLKKTNQIRQKIDVKSLGFKKKKKKSAACFVFATTTWSREVGVACLPGWATPIFPRQLWKAIIVMHVNELKSFKKKSKSMIKRKTWMRKKKVSCECSGSILKTKQKQTTATKNKKQFTHQSDSESHCGLLTRKKRKKRNNDQWQSRCHILLRSTKMKEN